MRSQASASVFFNDSSHSTGYELLTASRDGTAPSWLKSTAKMIFSFGRNITSDESEWLRPV